MSTAEIYKWVDENGHTHYSDQKPEQQNVDEINVIPHQQQNQPTPSTNNTHIDQIKAVEPYKKKYKVTMYSASWCGYCKKARAYFKQNKIRYTEYDIEKNTSAQKRYENLGGTGVPLLVAKRQKMQGFNSAQFENWYGNL